LAPQDTVLREQLQRLAAVTSLAPAIERVRVPAGCSRCNGSGYKGRIAIAEIVSINDEIRQAILRRADASEIEALYRKTNANSLLRSGA